MTPDALGARAAEHRLEIFGHCQTQPEDGLSAGTLVLFGPAEPGFWSNFIGSPEWQDGGSDPLDRWSTRVVGEIAADAGGTPLYPFGETLYPFMRWAIRSGRAWTSPVHLLVHDVAGLMVSFRGAIHLPDIWPEPPANASPCKTCSERPCEAACPVDALTPGAYELELCHGYLDTPAGARDCVSKGCAVRRSCPITQTYGRVDSQSSYHMERFHK